MEGKAVFYFVAHMKDTVLLVFLLAGCHIDFSAFPGMRKISDASQSLQDLFIGPCPNTRKL